MTGADSVSEGSGDQQEAGMMGCGGKGMILLKVGRHQRAPRWQLDRDHGQLQLGYTNGTLRVAFVMQGTPALPPSGS